MDILSDKLVKIRKPHRCFACQRRFEIGTEIRRQVNIFDGEFGMVYSCNTCVTLMKNHKEEFIDTSENAFPQDCVQERLNDYMLENPEQLLEFLTPLKTTKKK